MTFFDDLKLAARLARRELRAGLRGFGIFLACMALGVAAVAGVRSLSAAYAAGVAADAAALLGGDIEASLSLRAAAPDELAALTRLGPTSHLVSMQVMVRRQDSPGKRGLASLRAADAAYPLYGTVTLDPPLPLAEALAVRDGLPGAVVAPQLLARLGAGLGDVLEIADAAFVVRATLVRDPDASAGLSVLGPRLLVSLAALDTAGLNTPSTFTRHAYRVKLPPGANAAALAKELRDAFPASGWRVRDLSSAQPGLTRFMDRLAAVTGLVGLASLLLGGIGVSQAVAGYLAGRSTSIAALKCLGAPRRVVVTAYLLAVGAQGCLGIALGLALGAAVPALLGPLAGNLLPVSLPPGPYPAALAVAAAFGLLTVLAFSLPQLALAGRVSPLVLFRGYGEPEAERLPLAARLPGLLSLAALLALAVAATPNRRLGLGFVVAAAAATAIFWLFARLAVWLVRLAPLTRPGLFFLALRAVVRPGNQVGRVLAALGLGLSTLCAMTQVEANFREAFVHDIPRTAPDYFFVDIQPDQLADFLATARAVPGVTRVETSPMVRGRIVRIKGVSPEEGQVGEEARWAVSGDRGLTYAAAMPQGTQLVAGQWWPPDYAGEPLASMDEGVAKGLGLTVGDSVTINVLGREITVTIASLRRINWLTLGINYVFVLSPGSLDGAPVTHLATAYTDKAAGAGPGEAVFAAVTNRFPNVTAVGIGEALNDVLAVADTVAAAVSAAAAATLVTGMLVLVQTMAAGLRRRAYEAVIYKVCGATRRTILTVLLLENALLGLLAGVTALAVGTAIAWGFTTFFMELPFRLFAGPAVAIVAAATGLTLLLGLAGLLRLLSKKALPYLRNE
ncbi:FtsX-like permease family protein [Desulfovibrio aerotolerans]|uniref:FtsX-like permease family protein n=1 Tax=Solidesulfovibrio aerotolerans TaxID=295255 RepID=A0A7C9N4Z8_9BACT|nr:FtsX-like permease family protein [Solidesulfovibrio aerotolerans]MYL82895.1 FtsX-like permease family protein [Solidesulfovibrio aerotolerans]